MTAARQRTQSCGLSRGRLLLHASEPLHAFAEDFRYVEVALGIRRKHVRQVEFTRRFTFLSGACDDVSTLTDLQYLVGAAIGGEEGAAGVEI